MIRRDKVLALFTISFCLGFLPFLNSEFVTAEEQMLEPVFYISVLAPSTCPARVMWPTILVEELPKAGIGVDIFDHTGWAQISPRTWSYPGPFPIPPYNESGFDILCLGWGFGMDWNPLGFYDTASITPNGDNFYQYSNQEMDWAIYNYSASSNIEDRDYWGKEIQKILYEDLPSITVYYADELIPHDKNFDTSSWDGILWLEDYQSMENWTIPGQTEFWYAVPADFVDFHIYTADSNYDSYWLNQIYTGLVERNHLEPYNRDHAPRLATSITSSDGITYDVHINPNAVWADGHVLNASDIDYSFELYADMQLNDIYCIYINNESVTIIDEFHVEIEFLQPFNFQNNLIELPIIPKHIWNGIDKDNQGAQALDWATNNPEKIIGAGPYSLAEFDSSNMIIHLERNNYFDDWSGIIPYFDDIYFKFYYNKEEALLALANGSIDMVDAFFGTYIDEVPEDTDYSIIASSGYQEIAINMEHPILGSGEWCPIAGEQSAKYVRRAISHIIPREFIIEEALYGLGSPGIVSCPKTSPYFDGSLDPYNYSIETAKEYLRMAGYDIPYAPSITVGINFPVILGIISLIGGFYIFARKRK